MRSLKAPLHLLSVLAILAVAPSAQAQWAVIDVSAIAQLVQQLKQMQQEYQSITGARGMQSLLSGTNRNYLPSQFGQIATTLSGVIQTNINALSVLTPSQVAALSSGDRQVLMAARQDAAMVLAASEVAYANASGRFASIQQLIDAIGGAGDQKAALELQARIQGELGMLQNENTKMNVLFQAAQAQEWALRQRAQEQAVADVGSLRNLPPLRLP